MELCSSGHDEVCFEGRQCPVCEAISDKNQETEDMIKEIDDLKDENRSLTDDLKKAEEQWDS